MALSDPIFIVNCDHCGLEQEYYDTGVIHYANDTWGFDKSVLEDDGWEFDGDETICPTCFEKWKENR